MLVRNLRRFLTTPPGPADLKMVAVSDYTLRGRLQELLAREPDAQIAAYDDRAVRVPLDPSLRGGSQTELPAGALIDLVLPSDRGEVVAAWEHMVSTGWGMAQVRLIDGRTGVGQLFDMRDLGMRVLVMIEVESDDRPPSERPSAVPRMPRLSSVRKNELSVVIDADASAEIMFGWARAEFVGRRSLELVHRDDHAQGIQSWIEMLSAPGVTHRWQGRHLCSDGSYKWVEFHNTNLLDGPEAAVVCEMIDIGDEVEAREALVASERLFKGLAEALPLGVAQLELSGSVVFANERLETTLSGSTARPGPTEELRSPLTSIESVRDYVIASDRPRFDRLWGELVLHESAYDAEFLLRDGRSVELVARPLYGSEPDVADGTVVCVSDVSDRVRARRELERRALVDPLTMVLNRHGIDEHLRDVLSRPERAGTAVVFIDIDAFKRVNDDLGHSAGDEALIEIAERLRSTVRSRGDEVGRIGGDEFMVVCSDVSSDSQAQDLRDRIDRDLNHQPTWVGTRALTASVGVAWTPDSESDPTDLVRRSDEDMYRVKRAVDRV